jgi:predicted O-linked N-acetylglucosamine transferase (SPINDLY family)
MHMEGSRLLVFARKPAPVQICWLAYPGTTGLETMDYRISDPFLDAPDGTTGLYAEKTVFLPRTFWCYDPMGEGPEVNPPPVLKNSYMTFGCLNNVAKVSEVTLEMWARVLARIPESRMRVLASGGIARERIQGRLEAEGISRSRIGFIDRQPREQYLETYHQIDLCLDTFPCNGHTTTLDALWMGVPTISRSGSTAISRGGLSILSNAGMADWVAKSAEQYVDLAVKLASDRAALEEHRSRLRSKLMASPLMDAGQFARDMEGIFRGMWGQWSSPETPRERGD